MLVTIAKRVHAMINGVGMLLEKGKSYEIDDASALEALSAGGYLAVDGQAQPADEAPAEDNNNGS